MGKIKWVPSSSGRWPSKSLKCGNDGPDDLYVIRVHYEGGVIPGKLHKGHGKAYIPMNGKEIAEDNYEVLVATNDKLKWKSASSGDVPSKAVRGGKSEGGETLYIGRAQHSDTLVVGKVHPSHQVLYAPYGGDELSFSSYEVLCYKKAKRHEHSDSDTSDFTSDSD